MNKFEIGETGYWIEKESVYSGEVMGATGTGSYRVRAALGETNISGEVLRKTPTLALLQEIEYRAEYLSYDMAALNWAVGELAKRESE